ALIALWVAIGAAALILLAKTAQNSAQFGRLQPWILLLNIAGAFVLAFILTVSFEFRELDADIRLGISTGMIGAFTTFSALCKETVRLMNGGRYFYAAFYILLSAALGLGAVWLGTAAARGLGKKWIALKKRRMK
nr:CrcB family protein [Clostridiales bacterium]